MTTQDAKLRMEINFIGPESALAPADPAKPVNFLFLLGQDPNGRPAKAVFSGPPAARMRDILLKQIEGSDLKTRRIAIEAAGEWGYAKEPRRKNGEVVLDASGKPVHDRQFTVKGMATLLSGPVLEVFRTQRAAGRQLKNISTLSAAVEKAEKSGDFEGALAKAKEALAGAQAFLETLGQRAGKTAAPADEYQAALAAATEGAVTESLSAVEPAAEPEAARPLPAAEELAPAVKPAPVVAPAMAAMPRRLPGQAPRPVAQIAAAAQAAREAVKTETAQPEAAKPEATKPEVAAPIVETPAETTATEAAATEAASAEPVVEPTADLSTAEGNDFVAPGSAAVEGNFEATAVVEAGTATIQPDADPEAAAMARFAKAGRDFVDADAAPAPALTVVQQAGRVERLDPVAETSPEPTPAPPPPVERPVTQPAPPPRRFPGMVRPVVRPGM